MIQHRDITLTTADGACLAARWSLPAEPATTVVLHGATAVPRGYYETFADWLAAHARARVLIYDYRDIGLSRPRAPDGAGGPAALKASMGDWLVADQDAALAAAAAAAGAGPLDVIGHSLGGLGLMFHAAAGRVRRLVAVASGSGWWRNHAFPDRARALAFWWAIGPAATALFGHVPARATGFGAAVPAPAFRQWRRWCMQPGFHRIDWGAALPAPALDAFGGALRLVGAEDDGLIPPAAMRATRDFYPAASARFALLSRADAGGLAIGHAGMFRPSRRALWPKIWGDPEAGL